MKNRTFLILMSMMAIFVLAACEKSTSVQTGGSTPTSKPTTQESASSQSTSSQSSSSQSTSSQSSWSQSSTQQMSLSVSSTTVNNSATINVHTLPGATITIDLNYCGQNTKKVEYADSTGNYTLNWTPDNKCGGMATAKVTASANGQSATNYTSFSVS